MAINTFSGGNPINSLQAAGKNKILNSDFSIWQRGTSISVPNSTNTYGPDRFVAYCTYSAGSSTVSQQTFTPGTAPVSGYEGQYFSRLTCGSTTTVWGYRQRIEDVRTFAGQTATFSFWIKASAANATTSIEFAQVFGTGGSSTVTTTVTGPSITTSWQRFSVTLTLPSVSGKTIGANSYVEITPYSTTGIASSLTVDTWGWQLEQGTTATTFTTATGNPASELAACQRYYYKIQSGLTLPITIASADSTNVAISTFNFPVTMRGTPTLDQTTGTNYYFCRTAGSNNNFNGFALEYATPTVASFYGTPTITSGASGRFVTNNASSFIAFSAEL